MKSTLCAVLLLFATTVVNAQMTPALPDFDLNAAQRFADLALAHA
jgi:hypothetical protein